MAKTKKRPKPQDKKTAAGVGTASKIAQAEMAEELLFTLSEDAQEAEAETETAKEVEDTAKEGAKAEEAEDKEKAEMLAILKRLMDDMGVSGMAALVEKIDEAEKRKLVRSYGLDEAAAALFLEQQEKVRALREAKEKAVREAMYAEMRKNPFYADVDSRREALEAFILRTGTTPREAYGALFAEERMEKMVREMEEKKSAAEKKAKHIPALSGGDAPENEGYKKLSEAEKWAAERAGMTPQEYARYKYAY